MNGLAQKRRNRMSLSSLAPTLLLVTLAMFASVVHALSSEASTEQVRARLLAESDAVYPGQTLTLGVEQRIIPHWHTYWINPGDSGLATKIEWTLPAGATVGDIQWPIPNRYTIGPITNYGYADEVTLLSAITVPADAKVGGTFPVRATVDWLVCEETCIPQQVQLGMELPIVAAGGSAIDGNASTLIAKARSQLPVPSPWSADIAYYKDRIELKFANLDLQGSQIKDVWFYASQWGHVVHGAVQPRRVVGDAVVIELQPGEAPPSTASPLEGVLVITEQAGGDTIARGVSITNHPNVVPQANIEAASITLPYALLFAFLGGIILNLMPCVFPVLSIKALSLLDHAQQSPLQTRLQGIVYTLGVLASFALLAAILLALRTGGAQIGWGFQFQSPLFVLIVAYLMFAVGLSLSGVFFVGGSITGVGASLASRSGYSGSFFTGVLATIVATPCTAPFMGAALGYALSQPAAALLAVFFSLGLGLATPYLLLSLWPRLQRALPKPGAWMESVKQVLAFPMYATAVWLVWVLAQQIGPDATVIALGGMVIIAFAAWIYANTRSGASSSRLLGSGVAATAVLAALVGGYFGVQSRAEKPANSMAKHAANVGGEHWEPYSADRLQALRTQGEPVFLNLTAAWCITCLVNERVALSDRAVVDEFKRSSVTYLKGDWTQRDSAITAILNQFGRSGVPLYVFYPRGSESKPVVLPQILTPETVLSAITQASTGPASKSPTLNPSPPKPLTEEITHVASNLR